MDESCRGLGGASAYKYPFVRRAAALASLADESEPAA